MNWIKCSERLPDPYWNVLIFADNQGSGEPKPYSIGMWIGDRWEFINHCSTMPNYGAWQDIGYPIDSEHITHWMPLPSQPNNDEMD